MPRPGPDHVSPREVAATADALALVLEHCHRRATGRETSPAVVAAVVGVEHVASIVDSTDAETLRRAVTEATGGRGTDELVEVVEQLVQSVAVALSRDGIGWVADAKVLNPETGSHPVATDLASLRAATRAARASFALPYYRDRYGSRGALYSLSDSSWIVHLAQAPPSVVVHQVTWLSDMLAAKGMPTWLMELHLATMTAELDRSGLDHGSLPHALDALTERRRAHVDDALLDQAEEWVRLNVTTPPTSPTGRLLAATVADTRAGVVRDGEALLSWLTDPARTSPRDAAALRAVHAQVDVVSARRSGADA